MMESFLEDGRQDYRKGVDLVYGQSVTDACMGWERTLPLFGRLAEAVRSGLASPLLPAEHRIFATRPLSVQRR